MPAMSKSSPPHIRRQSGIAAVEFALIAVILVTLAVAVFELGSALGACDALTKASRDAARDLAATPTASLPLAAANAPGRVVDAALAAGIGGFGVGAVRVSCAPVDCAAARVPADVSRVTVAIRYAAPFGVVLTPQTTLPYLW